MVGPIDNQHVEEFDKALEAWTDHRFASAEDLRDMAMFLLYLVNLSEHDGWVYDGHSLNHKPPMWLLVVRGTVDGVPSVVFSSGRTTIACIRIFMRKLKAECLEWTPDKFRA